MAISAPLCKFRTHKKKGQERSLRGKNESEQKLTRTPCHQAALGSGSSTRSDARLPACTSWFSR